MWNLSVEPEVTVLYLPARGALRQQQPSTTNHQPPTSKHTQTHLERGVPVSTFLPGVLSAVSEARERLGLDVALIMCFLRHLSEESAEETLR